MDGSKGYTYNGECVYGAEKRQRGLMKQVYEREIFVGKSGVKTRSSAFPGFGLGDRIRQHPGTATSVLKPRALHLLSSSASKATCITPQRLLQPEA